MLVEVEEVGTSKVPMPVEAKISMDLSAQSAGQSVEGSQGIALPRQ